MSEQRGVTVFIPALNEEKNLPSTIETVITAAKAAGNVPIEILIYNDGSTDGTANVIREYEKKYDVIRSVHHPKNTGWGVSFREAVQIAKYPRIAMYPGDGMTVTITLRDMLHQAYAADFVCAFTSNTEVRTKFRNLVSTIYTLIYTGTFNIPLKYINSTPVYPVELLRKLKLRCRRYSFPSEVTVRVLRSGVRFMEIPGFLNPQKMTSSAIRFKNLLEVVKMYILLVLDIYVWDRQQYSRAPVRVMQTPEELDLRSA